MFRSILVPLDGSPVSEQALPAAVALCRRTAARLHVVHVRAMGGSSGTPPTWAARLSNGERVYLDSVCSRVSDELGESVSFAVIPSQEPWLLGPTMSPEAIAARIAAYADANGVELIVMATHGRAALGRAWFGSVTEALLRTTDTPMLLVRPVDGAQPPAWSRRPGRLHLLVPLDGSAGAEEILEPVLALGQAVDARYTLLRVLALPSPAFDAMGPVMQPVGPECIATIHTDAQTELARSADSLRARGADVSLVTLVDPSPAAAILRFARENAVDAIALATHGRHGLARLFLGSVGDAVVRNAHCPVLLTRRVGAPAAVATAPSLATARV
jgi:nucleotide-binding universal stress UspA family protein